MKILLVYPKYPDTFWSFKQTLERFTSEKAAFPPLGLLTVAAMLPENWSAKLIDMNVENLENEDIDWADVVFVSAMLAQAANAQETILRCKEAGKVVAVGGPAFTACHEKFSGFDHVVSGEAEEILPDFLRDLESGSARKIYASAGKPDIKKTPVPRWSLIDFSRYATMPLQFSRGCPYDCEFCDIIVMYGRKQRTKSPEQMIREFQSLFDAGWRGPVFVVDDNFIGNKKMTKEMLRRIVEWQRERGYPFKLITEASINLADDKELMELMSEAGFQEVFVGIETVGAGSLEECGKSQNLKRDLAVSVRTIQSHGMMVLGGFIFGFDNDDPEVVFDETEEFIQENGIVIAMAGILNALPGTRLWKRLEKEGRLVAGDSMRGENTDGDTNIVPLMGRERLISGYRKIISSLYSPKKYYDRIEVLLKRLRPASFGKTSAREIKVLLRSLWKIGILDRERRFFFWKLLTKALFWSRGNFPVAVKLAVFGEHLQEFAKRFKN